MARGSGIPLLRQPEGLHGYRRRSPHRLRSPPTHRPTARLPPRTPRTLRTDQPALWRRLHPHPQPQRTDRHRARHVRRRHRQRLRGHGHLLCGRPREPLRLPRRRRLPHPGLPSAVDPPQHLPQLCPDGRPRPHTRLAGLPQLPRLLVSPDVPPRGGRLRG